MELEVPSENFINMLDSKGKIRLHIGSRRHRQLAKQNLVYLVVEKSNDYVIKSNYKHFIAFYCIYLHLSSNILPMDYNISLNQDILSDLGKKLKQHRLNQNLSSGELAKKSGVSVRTITGFERGEKNISLLNLIELLRVLRLVNNLSELLPELPTISPLELIEIEKKKRKRARK